MIFFKKNICKLVCLLMIVAFSPSASFAHKVMIFGWVEGDKVHTISKFSGGKKVQKAPVSVYNKKGELLLKGNTDEKGEFSFKVPADKELDIVLEASMGHKTSCVVEIVSQDEESPAKHIDTGSYEEDRTEERLVGSKEIAVMIEKTLDKKMAVVLRMIAEKEDKQSVTEIISGIGYILGLIGIALWVRSR